ncbi:MAG: hypothetical protein ACOC83_01195 [Gemmatimonadota bacterium]
MLSVALLSTACGEDGGPATELEPDRYVDVMARLALVDTAMASSVRAGPLAISPDSARSLILDRWSVTDDQLVSFARTMGRDPSRMRELWERVMSTADSLRDAGWTPDAEDADGG